MEETLNRLSLWVALFWVVRSAFLGIFHFRLETLGGLILYGLGLNVIRLGRVCARFIARRRLPEYRLAPPRISTTVRGLVGVHNLMARPLDVVLGYNNRRRPIRIDLEEKHVLVGGMTRSGKTSFLIALLVQLFSKSIFSPRYDVYLLNLKADPLDRLEAWEPLLAGYARIDDDGLARAGSDLLQEILDRIRRIRLGQEEECRFLVIIDEPEAMTLSEDKDLRGLSRYRLRMLAAQLASRGTLVIATQSSKYDVIPTEIRGNFLVKICFMVDDTDQSKMILRRSISEDSLPIEAGQFLARLPGRRGLAAGKTLLVKLPDEVEDIVRRHIETAALADWRLALLSDVAGEAQKGDRIIGINRQAPLFAPVLARLHPRGSHNAQATVTAAYRHFYQAGAFAKNGTQYKLEAEFPAAFSRVRRYIAAGRWVEEPPPIFKKEKGL